MGAGFPSHRRFYGPRPIHWAMRLEWAIDCHRNIAEDDLEELHADHCAVIRQSKEAHERKYDRHYIADLVKRLEATNKSLRELNRYGLMK